MKRHLEGLTGLWFCQPLSFRGQGLYRTKKPVDREEVTESKHSPFYNAIMPLFKRWRDNLRKQFRKTFDKVEPVTR